MIRSDRVIRWQTTHIIMRHQRMHLLSLQHKHKHVIAPGRSYSSDTRKRLSVSISAKKIDNELKLLAHLFAHQANSTTNLDFWFRLWHSRRAPGHRWGKWRFSLIYWDISRERRHALSHFQGGKKIFKKEMFAWQAPFISRGPRNSAGGDKRNLIT